MDAIMIKEQFNDILESITQEFQFELYEEITPNQYGGNPLTKVYFKNVVINGVPYKDKTFAWQRATQSEMDFINYIKAYLFDVLDGVVNL